MKYQQAKSLLDRLCDLAILFHASSELRTKMFEALDEHIPHLDQGCFERGCPMDDEPQPHKLSRDLRAALAQQVQQTPESIYHPCTFILIKGLKELKAWDVLAEWDKAREIVDKRFRTIERAHGIKEGV